MQGREFSCEFKLEAVRLVRERGVAVAQAARDLDVPRMLRLAIAGQLCSGQPFATVEPLQAQLRRLLHGLGAEGYSFHGLRKNACCYLLELGLSDATVGSLLGMSAQTVRHYGKRTRALMLAREAAHTITAATVLPLKRGA